MWRRVKSAIEKINRKGGMEFWAGDMCNLKWDY